MTALADAIVLEVGFRHWLRMRDLQEYASIDSWDRQEFVAYQVGWVVLRPPFNVNMMVVCRIRQRLESTSRLDLPAGYDFLAGERRLKHDLSGG